MREQPFIKGMKDLHVTILYRNSKELTEYAAYNYELFGKILEELERSYKKLLKGNKRALINDWIRLNSTLGSKVIIKNHDRIISGIAENISDNGELIIRLPSGEMEIVTAGEVTILKDN